MPKASLRNAVSLGFAAFTWASVAMIDADECFVPFAPDYQLNFNHKIAKKDVHDAGVMAYQYK